MPFAITILITVNLIVASSMPIEVDLKRLWLPCVNKSHLHFVGCVLSVDSVSESRADVFYDAQGARGCHGGVRVYSFTH